MTNQTRRTFLKSVAGAATTVAIEPELACGEPSGAMRIFNPLTRLMVKRNVEKDYERLKQLLDLDR